MKRHVVLFRRMARPLSQRGSAFMRAEQLASILAPHLDPDISISVRPFHALLMSPPVMHAIAASLPRGTLCIFVKSAAKHLSLGHLSPLRKRGMTIAHDVVDTKLSHLRPELFDVLIAASSSGQKALQSLTKSKQLPCQVELLHHHFDPRLTAISTGHRRYFSCAYIGRRDNAYIPGIVEREIESIEVNTIRDFHAALPRIGSFAMHYGVRPQSQTGDSYSRGYKPFTKGFTAAACGATILVNRDVDDALDFLGADYPFLADQTAESVAEALKLAHDSYLGPIWIEALDRMKMMRGRVGPDALARQFTHIVTHATPLR